MPEIAYACVYYFGSWNQAVLAAGLVPNRSHSQRMYKRANAKASDGHVCDSVSEAIIDNWLTAHNISHQKGGQYPGTNFKTDWMVGDVFIEYFGLAKDSPRYDREIKKKRNFCHSRNIKLIEIYPHELYPSMTFEKKLQKL